MRMHTILPSGSCWTWKSLQKARISDLQHTNKNFTEILPCDTFSW